MCGGDLTVRSRAHGNAPRSFRYVCSTHHYRGAAICPNGLELRLDVAEAVVLDLVRDDLLRPTVVEPAIRLALDTLLADAPKVDTRRRDLERQLGALDGKIGQLTAAIEAGANLPALLAALEARERERVSLQAELRSLAAVAPAGRRTGVGWSSGSARSSPTGASC